jgi:hypothetical protein
MFDCDRIVGRREGPHVKKNVLNFFFKYFCDANISAVPYENY